MKRLNALRYSKIWLSVVNSYEHCIAQYSFTDYKFANLVLRICQMNWAVVVVV